MEGTFTNRGTLAPYVLSRGWNERDPSSLGSAVIFAIVMIFGCPSVTATRTATRSAAVALIDASAFAETLVTRLSITPDTSSPGMLPKQFRSSVIRRGLNADRHHKSLIDHPSVGSMLGAYSQLALLNVHIA